jgi:hypothetical protein
MTDIAKKIREVRPKLKTVSPLTAAIMLGYGVINILLGLGMLVYVNPSPDAQFAIINDVVTFQVWGIIFILLGLTKLYGYFKNDWKLMKVSLVLGLVVKATWAIALFIRFLDGGSILLLIVWLFFAYIQFVTYINFIPNLRQKLT